MLNNKTFLAIIPARGGSKRLPRKNILKLAGKPLIAWTIEAAKSSKYIDKVVVTSDDKEILDLSSRFGVDVILRPAELASDDSSSFDAIKHAIDSTSNYDYVILLQPTSPLRTGTNIDESIELLYKKGADGVVSVTEMDHSPLWANTLPENHSMENFLRDEVLGKRSQELPIYYRLNGAIYICEMSRLLSEQSFFIKSNVFAYKMRRELSIDIDTIIDLKFAEVIAANTLNLEAGI